MNFYQFEKGKKCLSTCETVEKQVSNGINVMHHSGQQSSSQPQHCCRLFRTTVWTRMCVWMYVAVINICAWLRNSAFCIEALKGTFSHS